MKLTKELGVIGGLGPMATAYFLELITKMTDAKHDQEHLNIVIYNRPSIPDRTNYILGKSDNSPAVPMINIGKALVNQGVDYIAIPCITAHYFYDTLTKEITVPIIHIVKETVKHLKDSGVQSAGIMATDGTIASHLFQNELQANGIDVIIPSHNGQIFVMDLIYKNVKADKPVEMNKFMAVSHELKSHGAEVIILGCTELSLIKRYFSIGAGYIDAMEVLAMRSILLCKAPLKQEYKCLITKGESYANKRIGILRAYSKKSS